MSAPILMAWDGEAMRPVSPFWARKSDDEYVIGERYQIAVVEERSQASHNHYFAELQEAWSSLPDEKLADFPTVEHLRKKCLIRAGYYDERSIVCSSKAEAQRLAAFIRPTDDFAIISVHEATVVELKAKSQSMRAMGKQAFQESKDRVLAIVADLLGVEPSQLGRRAA